MTSAEAKAYLTRARDAELDIVMLDDDCPLGDGQYSALKADPVA